MAHEHDGLEAALGNRYSIERELGRGGMAVVYLAQDRKLNRPVALKVLRHELAVSIGAERFLREIEIAAKLTHPNILALHDCGQADDVLYYTMPFIEGESLRNRLDREKQLPIDDAVQIAQEVADALDHAHTHGIVHRDVKPENILLEAGHAVVADFGIARAVSEAGAGHLTDTGLVVGTPAYMSPEQATGGQVDGRSDVYALACVLYEMLAGEPPYTGLSAQAVVAKKLTEPVPRVSVLRAPVRTEVEQAIRRALERVPADRFRTAREFGAALSTSVSAARKWAEWTPRRGILAGVAAGVLLVAAAWAILGLPSNDDVRVSVAALPFANLSGLDDDVFFTDGIHSEILTQLQKVSGIKVVSRTSVMAYRDSPKNARDIGRELEVRYLLEGEVQRAASDVRINVQLIDATRDAHVWGESYDRAITIGNLFDVQSDIARQVAGALRTRLTPEERAQIEAMPTQNLEAYQAYLRGQYYMRLPHFTVEDLMRAFHEFRRAAELDSTFAIVQAEVAKVHAQEVYFSVDVSQHQRDSARVAIERAVRMDSLNQIIRGSPESPDVRLALGLYYLWVNRDGESALREIARAEVGSPSNPAVPLARAWTYDLQGHLEKAVAEYENALEMSPRDAEVLTYLALDHWIMRRYPEALRYADRAINLAPDQLWPNLAKVFATWSYMGPSPETEEILDALPRETGWVIWSRYWQRMKQDRYEDALGVLAETDADWVRLKMWARPKPLLAGLTSRAMGQHDEARRQFDEARQLLEEEVEAKPSDARFHSSLGLAYAGLGRGEDALREGATAMQLLPVTQDAWYGLPYAIDLAAIHAMLGNADAATRQLEHTLAIPSWISPTWLEFDFRFDDVRSAPRFQILLTRDVATNH